MFYLERNFNLLILLVNCMISIHLHSAQGLKTINREDNINYIVSAASKIIIQSRIQERYPTERNYIKFYPSFYISGNLASSGSINTLTIEPREIKEQPNHWMVHFGLIRCCVRQHSYDVGVMYAHSGWLFMSKEIIALTIGSSPWGDTKLGWLSSIGQLTWQQIFMHVLMKIMKGLYFSPFFGLVGTKQIRKRKLNDEMIPREKTFGGGLIVKYSFTSIFSLSLHVVKTLGLSDEKLYLPDGELDNIYEEVKLARKVFFIQMNVSLLPE